MTSLSPWFIARIAHQVNKAYCESVGDFSQKDWEDSPAWQQESAVNGVKFHLNNPDALPSDSHDSWLKEKIEQGWTWGPVKDAERKQHPCCVPYDELPAEQKSKDFLFKGVVESMRRYV